MYYYEHENGAIINKPDIVVDMGGGPADFFDSPLVKRWWHEPDKQRRAHDPSPAEKRLAREGREGRIGR